MFPLPRFWVNDTRYKDTSEWYALENELRAGRLYSGLLLFCAVFPERDYRVRGSRDDSFAVSADR